MTLNKKCCRDTVPKSNVRFLD